MSDITNLQKGKLPPQAIDLEEAVLGAILINSESIELALDVLKKESFYKESHLLIFEAMQQLFEVHEPIDLLTVSNRLRDSGNLETAGGQYALIELTQKISSSANVDYHSRIIAQKKLQRDLIKISNEIIEKAYNETEDVFELLDETYNKINEVSETVSKSTEKKVGSVVDSRINRAVKIFKNEIESGIKTPFEKINNNAGGWRDTEFIIIAGRPGMGKTSFALKDCVYSAQQGTPTAFFSLEMSAAKLTDRILSMEGKVDSEKFNIKGLSPEDVSAILPTKRELQKIPLYIDDCGSLTVQDLRVKLKRMVRKFGIKKAVIDYLQLMSGKGNNREQEISKISRGLKKLAMELQIPIIALSQLSRAVETRGGSKRPLLSDLRDSGAIEQDADIVVFAYRPEYYGIEEWDDDERSPTQGQAEIIYAKNRNGGLVKVRLKFEGRYTLFTDLNTFEFEEEPEKIPFASPKDAFSDDDNTPF